MKLVLDASMALAWCITRTAPVEAALAQQLIASASSIELFVPSIWFAEVANTLLVFERAKRMTAIESDGFLASLTHFNFHEDDSSSATLQSRLISAGRAYQLTAYDAFYFELAHRKRAELATFDRKLAEAFRKSGGRVFGDPS